MQKLSEAQRKKWRSLIDEKTYLKIAQSMKNAERMRKLIRNLGNDPKNAKSYINVTSNEISHQLLENRKCHSIKKVNPEIIKQTINETDILHTQFTLEELNTEIARIKGKRHQV